MTTNVKHIISQGESQNVEFKSNFSKEVIETIVAFSNTKGGYVIIGVKDDKQIIGVQLADESLPQWINEIKTATIPQIVAETEVVEIENKTVVVFYVAEFPIKPVAYKESFFVRKQNSNHKLTTDEIVEIRFQSLNYSFDAFEVETKFDELDASALSFFKKRLIENGRYTYTDSYAYDFKKLGFIRNSKLTRAAELLFGTHCTAIHIGRFKSQTEIIDDIIIRIPLILAVEEAINFIKRNITLGFEFGGNGLKRKERWQYPIPALREILLNAIVHRDYSHPNDVIIKIFDKYIEFVNPGKLMGDLTIEAIKTDNYQARHRNKLLAEAFYLTGDIEKYGTGFRRIKNWLTIIQISI